MQHPGHDLVSTTHTLVSLKGKGHLAPLLQLAEDEDEALLI